MRDEKEERKKQARSNKQTCTCKCTRKIYIIILIIHLLEVAKQQSCMSMIFSTVLHVHCMHAHETRVHVHLLPTFNHTATYASTCTITCCSTFMHSLKVHCTCNIYYQQTLQSTRLPRVALTSCDEEGDHSTAALPGCHVQWRVA